MKVLIAAILVLIVTIYAALVVWGVRLGNSSSSRRSQLQPSIPWGKAGDDIRRGRDIFNHTPEFASGYVASSLSCESCHAAGGIQPFAAPMAGVTHRFPQYSYRARRTITLPDRIRECFVRSENGNPPSDSSRTMQALLAYLNWLSPAGKDANRQFGTGLVKLPDLVPDPVHGAAIYTTQCAGCHGIQGEGQGNLWPPLWGPKSFNQGSGMYRISTLAAFVQHNMPQNRMGQLSPQDAYDVAAFVHQQPRPPLNPDFARY